MEQISIIIPCRNAEKYISNLFLSLINQDYPKEKIEILIIDGGSNDNTVKEIEKNIAINNNYYRIQLLHNPIKYVPQSLNIAIRETSFNTIIRLDVHTTYPNNYFSQIVLWKNKLNAGNVGGIAESIGVTLKGQAISEVMSSKFGMGNTDFRTVKKDSPPIEVDTVPFGIFSKKTLNKIGFFDERFIRHQDYEMNYRIRKNGWKIFLIPSIKVQYSVRESYTNLYNQFKGYGFYKGKFLRMYKKGLRLRHLIPVLLSLSLMLGLISIISLPYNYKIIGFIIFILPYLLFLIFASANLSLKNNKNNILRYFVILPIIHMTWGINVLIGFLQKPFQIKKFK